MYEYGSINAITTTMIHELKPHMHSEIDLPQKEKSEARNNLHSELTSTFTTLISFLKQSHPLTNHGMQTSY